MPLALTNRDQESFRAAVTLLAAPLESPSAAEWKTSLLKAVEPLFDSGAGAFVLPHEGEPPVTLLNRPDTYLEEYTENQHLDLSMGFFDSAHPGICCTESASAALRSRFSKSELYALVYSKYQIREAIWTVFEVSDQPAVIEPGRVFAPHGVPVTGMLVQYAERAGNQRFANEGMDLMALLRPMLRAAAQTWKDLGSRRDTLTSVIDAGTDALAIHDSTGALVHANPEMARLLGNATTREPLTTAVRNMATDVSALLSARTDAATVSPTLLVRDVVIGADHCRLSGTAIESLVGLPGAILVRVRRVKARGLDKMVLRRRFALTEREAEVALLLASGKSNRSIARAMGVSEHTARRHTEKVLAKLGIESRSQVAFRLAPDGSLEMAGQGSCS